MHCLGFQRARFSQPPNGPRAAGSILSLTGQNMKDSELNFDIRISPACDITPSYATNFLMNSSFFFRRPSAEL